MPGSSGFKLNGLGETLLEFVWENAAWVTGRQDGVFWLSTYDDFMRIMASGHPPLGLQFLVANTVFLIVVILQRLRKQTRANLGAHHVTQISLVVMNALIAMQDSFLPLLHL